MTFAQGRVKSRKKIIMPERHHAGGCGDSLSHYHNGI
jgi:hypothetical protein